MYLFMSLFLLEEWRKADRKKGMCISIMTKQLFCLSKLRLLFLQSQVLRLLLLGLYKETYPTQPVDFVLQSDAVRGADHSWSYHTNSDICFNSWKAETRVSVSHLWFHLRFLCHCCFYEVCLVGRKGLRQEEKLLCLLTWLAPESHRADH